MWWCAYASFCRESDARLACVLGCAFFACQTLGFEKCGGVGDEVSVIPVDDGVTKSGLLPTVPRAVVAREVCDFLATLAVAFPGSAVG
jgi:hypothetical protein